MTDYALSLQQERTSGARPVVKRFWEVDVLRGVAIIMVVVYHLAWDLRSLAGWDIDLYGGFWHYFQRVTASTFIFLVGLSLTISYRRVREWRSIRGIPFFKYARRSLKLLFWAGVISLVTWLAIGQGYIQFGILHFIAVAIVLAYPFLRFRLFNLILGLALLLAGPWVASIHVETGWLIWLGLTPTNYFAVDFFPLIPWFGVVLLGIFWGNSFYSVNQRALPLPDWTAKPGVPLLSRLGRHTLLIYLVHQPILITLLVVLGIADVGSI